MLFKLIHDFISPEKYKLKYQTRKLAFFSQLKDIYQNDQLNHNSWVAIPDSKEGTITPEVIGNSGGETGNAWKIHISIDPSKMAEAAEIIWCKLNAPDAPKISIKFAGNVLAGDSQPGKQVAFTPYAEAMITFTGFVSQTSGISLRMFLFAPSLSTPI